MTAAPARPTGGYGLSLAIDLAALVANWRDLRDRAAPAECAAVVKADAYGLGAAEVGPVLLAAGCRTFFVALPSEGATLRTALAAHPGGAAATIYVLDGLFADAVDLYRRHDLRPVLGSLAELARWRALSSPLAAALHVDTGMNRLGLRVEEAEALATSKKAPPFALVMSHFACADAPDHPLNARQVAAFDRVRRLFADIPASLANSAGILFGRSACHDLVRPGIGLYGGDLRPGVAMRPVVIAAARILAVRSALAGETVGYAAGETLRRRSRVAILAAGYADGFLRSGSASDGRAGGTVAIGGHPAPILGRVSMDLTAVDVTDLPEAALGSGAAELFGATIPVDVAAAAADTIAYELLTGLSRRAQRTYLAA